MVEIKKRNNLIVRRSLWEAYKKKCFYCSRYISFNNFEVDHPIPKSLGKEEAIKLYELQNDFELNSYYNLVPTCPPCNKRKKDHPFEKQHVLYYLNIIEKKISNLEKLEKKIKDIDKKSEISATLSTALNEITCKDILTIMKEQNLSTYKKRILQDSIQKISTIDIEDVINLRNQKKTSEYGLALSILSVIEPIDYNMANGNIFYNDFGIVFLSTSEMLGDKIEQQVKIIFNEISTKKILFANLDDLTNRLKELSNQERYEYDFLFEIISYFAHIMVFTQQNVNLRPFSQKSDTGAYFCLYVGTQNLNLDEIIRKQYEKSKFWMENKDLNLKKSYLIIASEI
ncbi:MAG: HNH endonuclease [Candidatus Thorarchaeota archaeon]